MKVGDELREFADAEVLSAIQISDLKHMAKRIDAGMVELPRSADGRIFTSYEVCFWTDSGDEFEYHRFGGLVRQDGKWFAEDSDGIRYEPKFAWLEHPDSFERIADELERYVNDSCGEDEIDGMTASTLVDFAKRIRKLAESED